MLPHGATVRCRARILSWFGVTYFMNDANLNFVALIGSLRQKSFNRGLFEAARLDLPDGVSLTDLPIGDLPHFNQDIEADPPASVVAFKDALRSADGVVVFTPEYNGGMPGVLKNALDWGSRPFSASVIAGTPAIVLGAAAGRLGTAKAQIQVRQQFVALDLPDLHKPEFYLPFAGQHFDANGMLTDADSLAQIKQVMAAFTSWVRLLKA